jgi:hypothetical protein
MKLDQKKKDLNVQEDQDIKNFKGLGEEFFT